MERPPVGALSAVIPSSHLSLLFEAAPCIGQVSQMSQWNAALISGAFLQQNSIEECVAFSGAGCLTLQSAWCTAISWSQHDAASFSAACGTKLLGLSVAGEGGPASLLLAPEPPAKLGRSLASPHIVPDAGKEAAACATWLVISSCLWSESTRPSWSHVCCK